MKYLSARSHRNQIYIDTDMSWLPEYVGGIYTSVYENGQFMFELFRI